MGTEQNTQSQNRQITDVVVFFSDLTASYLAFEQQVHDVMESVNTSSPNKIAEACIKLTEERNKLSGLDDQLLQILELAEQDLATSHMIHDYRVAFAKATMACNNLYQKLQGKKSELSVQASHLEQESSQQ